MLQSTGQTASLLSDNILLEQIATGDEASFETIFHQHYDRVYGLLFRLLGTRSEAEDLTQEVFIKLYHHAFTKKLFRRKQEHNLSAWLYRVATNMGYNAIRGRNRRWQRDIILVPDPQGQPPAEKEVERRETETAVRAALTQLKPKQAQLLILRQMGLSYAECAEACEVAPGSVGTLLSRAGKAFKQAYEEGTGV